MTSVWISRNYSTCFMQFVYMEHHSIDFHGQWQYEVKNLPDAFFRWTFSVLYFIKASVALFQNLSHYLKVVSNAPNDLEMHDTFQLSVGPGSSLTMNSSFISFYSMFIFVNVQNQQVVNKQHEIMNYYYYYWCYITKYGQNCILYIHIC